MNIVTLAGTYDDAVANIMKGTIAANKALAQKKQVPVPAATKVPGTK